MNKTAAMDSTCSGTYGEDLNFDGVTDIYGNAGGGFVAYNSDTGAVQCFGHPQNGGVCPDEVPEKAFDRSLKMYQASYAFLLYDPGSATADPPIPPKGVCWGDRPRFLGGSDPGCKPNR